MQEIVKGHQKTAKIYKEKAVWLGTLLGGPLVTGYFISQNYKVFGEHEKAKQARAYSHIATVLLLAFMFTILDSVDTLGAFLPLSYTIISFYLVKHFQKKDMHQHLETGGAVFGWGRIITIGLIGLLIMMIVLLLIFLSMEIYHRY